jgi:hypothetical protein
MHALSGLEALLKAHDEYPAAMHIFSATTILASASPYDIHNFVHAFMKEFDRVPGKKAEVNVQLLSTFCKKQKQRPISISDPDVLLANNFCNEIIKARKAMNSAYYDPLDNALASMKQFVGEKVPQNLKSTWNFVGERVPQNLKSTWNNLGHDHRSFLGVSGGIYGAHLLLRMVGMPGIPLPIAVQSLGLGYWAYAPDNLPLNRKHRDAYHNLLRSGAPIDFGKQKTPG